MTQKGPSTISPDHMDAGSGLLDPLPFADWLKERRIRSGMTLEQVAQEVRDRGQPISINKLWRIENGRTKSVDHVLKSVLEACFKETMDSEDATATEPVGSRATRLWIVALAMFLLVSAVVGAIVFSTGSRSGLQERAGKAGDKAQASRATGGSDTEALAGNNLQSSSGTGGNTVQRSSGDSPFERQNVAREWVSTQYGVKNWNGPMLNRRKIPR